MGKLTKKAENLLILAWAQAFIAMAGSLFYSEVMGYIPCELCWFQRILMYPLVVIYAVAAIKKEINIALPGLVFSGIGMFVSAYHYLIQKVPAFQEMGGACIGGVPCNVVYVDYLGFITIPFLALTAFTIISILHVALLINTRKNKGGNN
ncbi:disulfide oxidoreductase [Oceanobacillus halophilus]|uniref:Probable disulfide formation protein n=1 Tax=Oceanobacillus halophilus TaxID=930130 RepID=A0A494ZYV4_9BACI|nr:disulfide oxidoreductase [Oceanobacillus halophilus]RKQ31289.1 disulfide bond formation protein B [Oceanobacillus halophilus]